MGWSKWESQIGMWGPFTDRGGRTIYSPMEQAANAASFYAAAIPLLNEYLTLVIEELRKRGFAYQSLDHAESSDLFTGGLTWYDRSRFEKNGIAVEYLFQWHTARDLSPTQAADRITSNWEAAAYHGYAPPATEQPAGAPASGAPPTSSGPGPATTVSMPASTQPAQAPETPSAGTLVDPPAADGPYTFDQWNYVYQQETGRAGPSPEAVGFPVARRSEPISREEWWSYAGPWFVSAGGSGGTGGSGGAGGSGPGNVNVPPAQTPITDIYSLVAAVLTWIGLLPTVRNNPV